MCAVKQVYSSLWRQTPDLARSWSPREPRSYGRYNGTIYIYIKCTYIHIYTTLLQIYVCIYTT